RPVLREGSKWQLTCYEKRGSGTEAFAGRVIYQIFPDRFNRAGFCDTQNKLSPFYLHENPEDIPAFLPNDAGEVLNNDFFGGNLRGIIEKLPYLKSLGVGILYLNPIFMAFSNHRYDTADYMQIDPLLGNKQDFSELCRKAHDAGIKVILDGVFSHTGSNSRYFDVYDRFGTGALHHPDSPYRSWYRFFDYPHHYETWWGIKTLPCVEECNESYQNFILTGENSVVKHWLRAGADGWRLDVADELPDSFLELLYKTVKDEKKESLVIGEVWEDASNKISYGERRRYLQGGALDSVMNYVWRDGIIRFVRGEISAADFNESVMLLCEHYPKEALFTMMNLLSTHDTPRILTALAPVPVPAEKAERAGYTLDEDSYYIARERLLAAQFLQFMLPGCPSVYYGDEIGMQGFEDPFNRAYMGNRSGDEEVRSHVKQLGKIRKESKAILYGRTEPFLYEEGLYAFFRIYEKERILCAVNCGSVPRRLPFATEAVLYNKNTLKSGEGVTLLPCGFLCFKALL
ncbi:MAG: glycoside hydrolase family 13 protein, partial [Clostridia bacterium]|nr:glycoside hydrolase family 13 protein [Clostridia bacterium]